MAKESSVAPKERVNIRYKPATGDAKEEVELPLKIMVLGDFTQREDDTPLEDRDRLSINKDNFNDVLRSQKLDLQLKVKNELAGENSDENINVGLKLETMRDFEPEAIARQIPEMNQLLELRQALMALKGPLGNMPAFRKAIQDCLGDEQAKRRLMKELGL